MELTFRLSIFLSYKIMSVVFHISTLQMFFVLSVLRGILIIDLII